MELLIWLAMMRLGSIKFPQINRKLCKPNVFNCEALSKRTKPSFPSPDGSWRLGLRFDFQIWNSKIMGCLLPMLTFVQFIVRLGFRRFDNFFVARMGSYLACYRLDVLDVRFHVPVCNVSAFSRDFKKQRARERGMIFHICNVMSLPWIKKLN